MATGPSIRIQVEDKSKKRLDELKARADDVKKAINEIDKEMQTLAKSGQRISGELQRKLQARQVELSNANRAIREERALIKKRPKVESIHDLKEELEKIEPAKLFKRAVRDTLKDTKAGEFAEDFIEGGGARRLGAGASYLAGGALITKALLMGLTGENKRLGEMEDALKAAQARGLYDVTARKIAETEIERERINSRGIYQAASVLKDIPLIGQYVYDPTAGAAQATEARLRGLDEYALGREKVRLAARESGLGITSEQADALRDEARFQVLVDKWGSEYLARFENRIRGMLSEAGLSSNQFEASVDAKAESNLKKVKALEAEGFRLISENNWKDGETALNKAADAIGRDAWRNPFYVWLDMDGARKATIQYAQSQNPLPPLRIGM